MYTNHSFQAYISSIATFFVFFIIFFLSVGIFFIIFKIASVAFFKKVLESLFWIACTAFFPSLYTELFILYFFFKKFLATESINSSNILKKDFAIFLSLGSSSFFSDILFIFSSFIDISSFLISSIFIFSLSSTEIFNIEFLFSKTSFNLLSNSLSFKVFSNKLCVLLFNASTSNFIL